MMQGFKGQRKRQGLERQQRGRQRGDEAEKEEAGLQRSEQ